MALSRRQQLIYDFFKQNPVLHPTAEEVYQYIKTIDSKVGIATVYRNLKILVEKGILHELNVEKQGVRYDFPEPSHYHFLCDECGAIENFTSRALDQMDTVVENELQNKVTTKDIVFHGVCKRCITANTIKK